MNNVLKINKKILILCCLLLLCGSAVLAQSTYVPKPFTQRHSIYYPTTDVYHIKGDFTMIGNANLTTTSSSGLNNGVPLYYIDIDGDNTTVNSSSAELQFSEELGANPECSKVLYAGLYWTGKKESKTATGTNSLSVPARAQQTIYEQNNQLDGYIVGDYTLTISSTTTTSTRSISGPFNRSQTGTRTTETTVYTFTPISSGSTIVYTFTWDQNPSSWSYGTNWSVNWNYTYTSTLTRKVGNGNATQVATGQNVTTLTPSQEYALPLNTNITLVSFRRGNTSTAYVATKKATTIPGTAATTLYKNQVKFKHENGTYQTVTAHPNDIYFPTQANGTFQNMFIAYAEVTDIVREYGEGNYFCADIACAEGENLPNDGLGYFGGWGLVVVYENSNMSWRDVTVFDGLACVEGTNNESQNINIEGIKAVQVGNVKMKMGAMIAEGEAVMDGDCMEVEDRQGNYVKLSHGGNSANNFFNASISTGGNRRNPENTINLGFDCHMFEIPNENNYIIDNNQEELNLRFRLDADVATMICDPVNFPTYICKDTYFPFFMAFSCDAYIPDAEGLSAVMDLDEESYDDELGAYVINPGDTVTFHVDVKNFGTEDIVNAKLELPLPVTITHYSTGVNYAYPGITVTDYFDAQRGINGTAGWDISEIPAGDVDQTYATLELVCIVTEDCYVLAATDEDCLLELRVNGTLEGYSYVNNVYFKKPAFIRSFTTDGICRGDANRDDIRVIVDKATYLNMGYCNGDYTVRTLGFCENAYPGGVVPFNDIYAYYPLGTHFYNTTSHEEYTLSTGFPLPTGNNDLAITAESPSLGAAHCTSSLVLHNVSTTQFIEPTLNPSTFQYCLGEEAAPLSSAVTLAATNMYARYYTRNDGTAPGQMDIIPSTDQEGTYTYYVRQFLNNALGCEDPNYYPITVEVVSPISFQSNRESPSCVGIPIVVTGLPSGGSFSYSSELADYIDTTGNVLTMLGTMPAGTVTVTYTHDNIESSSCPEINSRNYTHVIAATTVAGTLTANQTICVGGSIQPLQLSGYSGHIERWEQASNLNGPWVHVPNNTATLSSADLNELAIGTYYFRALVKDGNCDSVYSNTVSVTVSDAAAPTAPVFASPQYTCPNTDYTIAVPDANATYNWFESNIGGAPDPSLRTVYVDQAYVARYVSLVDANSCESQRVTVVVRPNFTAGSIVAGTQTNCDEDGTATPIASQNNAQIVNGGGTIQYQWYVSINGADPVAITGATSATYTPSAYMNGDGTYVFTRKARNTACDEWLTSTNTWTLNVGKPDATVTANPGSGVACGEEGSVSLTLSAAGPATKYRYQWYKDGVEIPGATAQSYIATTPGNYSALVTHRASGCSATSDADQAVDVVINTPSVALSNITNKTICQGASTTLTASTTGTPSGTITYEWSPATGLSSTTSATVTASPTYTTTYTVTATASKTENGVTCTATDIKSVVVTVNPKPVLTAANVTTEYGTPATVSVSGASSYTWAPSTYLGTTTAASTSFSGANVGTYPYTITGTNSYGCTATTTDTVKVTPRPVTLTSGTSTRVYNGQPLTNHNVTVGGSGWVTGEGATYNVTGTRTEVGDTANTFTYTLNSNTLASNYIITKVEGTLTITPITSEVVVVIVGHTGTYEYDGNPHSVTGYNATCANALYNTNLRSNFTYAGDSTATRTAIGTTPMGLVAADFTNTNTNFTNVRFQITDGWVKIKDETDPTFTRSCSTIGNQTKNTDPGEATYTHSDTTWNAIATDNHRVESITYALTGATTGTGSSLNGVAFNVGVTTVTWTAVDSVGNDVSCSFTVTVVDNEDPCIGCTPDDPDDPTAGISCTSIGNQEKNPNSGNQYLHSDTSWDVTASDNVGVVSKTYVLTGATSGTGTSLNGIAFNDGVTTVTWTVLDAAGNDAVCSFTVTVADNTAPEITCAVTSDQDKNTGTHKNYYQHSGTGWDATATDNRGVTSLTYTVSGATTAVNAPNTTLNGQKFNIGTTTVTWIARDAAGNADTCSFNVIVTDNEPPCIGCNPENRDPFSEDGGISCETIGDQVKSTDPGENYYTQSDRSWDVTTHDNSGSSFKVYTLSGATTTVIAPNTTLNGQKFNIGTTTVTWTVTDPSGNEATCSFTVTVKDTEKPCIGCTSDDPDDPTAGVSCTSIGNQTKNTDEGHDYYTHNNNEWNITASDNVQLGSLTYSVSGATTTVDGANTTLNGQKFNIGTTVVMWVAADTSGNKDTCYFNVTVTDNEDPELNCPTISNSYECSSEVPAAYTSYAAFVAAGGSASDNDGIVDTTFRHVGDVSDHNHCPEVITRTYAIKDSTGNESTCTQQFVVNDVTTPTVSGLNRIVNAPNVGCNYSIPDVTSLVRSKVSDNCTQSAALTVTMDRPAGNPLPLQSEDTYWPIVVLFADECGNRDTVHISVYTPGTMTTTATSTTLICAGTEEGSITTEVTGGVAPFTYNWSTDPAQTTATATGLGVGTYTVTVTDANGCTSTAQATVSVDNVRPTITGTIVNDTIQGCSDSDVPAAYTTVAQLESEEGLSISDNLTADADLVVSSTTTHSGNYPVVYVRTYTITDECGNSSTVTHRIVMDNNVTPTISGADNVCVNWSLTNKEITFTTESGMTNYQWTAAGATILAGGESTDNTITLEFDNYGYHTVSVTYVTAGGCVPQNAASKTFRVEITPNVSFTNDGTCPNAGSYEITAIPAATITPYTYTYTWTGVDDNTAGVATINQISGSDCGHSYPYMLTIANNTNCTAVFKDTLRVVDEIAPTITGTLPTHTENGCSGNLATVYPAKTTLAALNESFGISVSDNCTSNANLTLTSHDKVTGNCTYQVIRTYVVEDQCGNKDSIQQTINIVRPNGPEEVGGPVSTGSTIVCEAQATAPTAAQMPLFKDYCGRTITPTGPEVVRNITNYAGTIKYVYTYTDCADSVSTWTYTYTVAPRNGVVPSLTTDGVTTICESAADARDTLRVQEAHGYLADYTYVWNVGANGTIISGDGTYDIKAMWSENGTREVILTMTDDISGCVYNDTIEVTINQAPELTLIPPQPITMCADESVTMNVAGANSFNWTAVGDAENYLFDPTNSTTTKVFENAPAGDYEIRITGTSSANCSVTDTVHIHMDTLPALVTRNITTCFDTTATLTASGAATYAWSANEGTLSSTTGSSVNYTNIGRSGDFYVTVTGTDGNGCKSTKTDTVTIYTQFNPGRITNYNDSICLDDWTHVIENEISAHGGDGNISYRWVFDYYDLDGNLLEGGVISDGEHGASLSAHNAVADGSNPGIYVSHRYAQDGCCVEWQQSAGVFRVTIFDLPDVKVTPKADTICQNEEFTLTASGATSYTWTPTAAVPAGFETAESFTTHLMSSQQYIVRGTDTNGCVNRDTAYITVHDTLPIEITGIDSGNYCPGATVSVVGSIDGEKAAPSYTYTWSIDGDEGTPSISPTTTTTTRRYNQINVTLPNDVCSSEYELLLSMTDSNQCVAHAKHTITMTDDQVPEITAINNSVDATASSSCTFTVPDLTTTAYVNATDGCSASPLTITQVPTAGTTITATTEVKVIAEDICGNKDTALISVTVPDALVSTTSITQNVLCNGGSTGIITASHTGGTEPFMYSIDNGSHWQTSAVFSGLASGDYTITIKDDNGCTATSDLTISQPVTLTVSHEVHNPTCFNSNDGNIAIIPAGGTAPYNYYAQGVLLTDSIIPNVVAASASPLPYSISDANGCTASGSATFTIPEQPYFSLIGIVGDVSCHGGNDGRMNLQVHGGEAPFSITVEDNHGHTWSDLPMPTVNVVNDTLHAGTYTFSGVDNNGCAIASYTRSVYEPDADVAVSVVKNVGIKCYTTSDYNDTLILNVSGGTPNYRVTIGENTYNGVPAGNLARYNVAPGNNAITVVDAHGCEATTSATISMPDPIQFTIHYDTIRCYEGEAEVELNITGGTAPYLATYEWIVTAGGLNEEGSASFWIREDELPYHETDPAGYGDFFIVDTNGCELDRHYRLEMEEPDPIVVNFTNAVINCYGGTTNLTANATGGTGTLRYRWVDGNDTIASTNVLANATAGNHKLVVYDDYGCEIDTTFVLNQPDTLVSHITAITQQKCDVLGSITVTTNGGTAPYQYAWSGSAAAFHTTTVNAPAEAYVVTVTDARGCTDTARGTITLNNNLNITSWPKDTICSEGSFSLLPNGSVPAGTTYSWAAPTAITGVSGLAAGTNQSSLHGSLTNESGSQQTATYTVTASAGPCSVTGTSQVTVLTNSAAAGTWQANDYVLCANDIPDYIYIDIPENYTNLTQPFTVDWILAGGTLSHTMQPGSTKDSLATFGQGEGTQAVCEMSFNYNVRITYPGTTCSSTTTGSITTRVPAVDGVWPFNDTVPYSISCINDTLRHEDDLPTQVLDGCGNELQLESKSIIKNLNETNCSGTITYHYVYRACNGTAGHKVYIYTLNDNVAPTWATTAPAEVDARANSNACQFFVPNFTTYGHTYGSDNCTASNDLIVTQSVAANTRIHSNTDVVVTITDACGNTSTQKTVSVVIPDTLMASEVALDYTNVTCPSANNGTAEVTVTSSASGISYRWFDGSSNSSINNLAPGSHYVIVYDANHCEVTKNFTVTQPPVLVHSRVSTVPRCYGGNDGADTAIFVSGGVLPITLTYTHGDEVHTAVFNDYGKQVISGLSSQSYEVVATNADGQCENFRTTITIASHDPIAENTPNITPVTCHDANNGAIALSIHGGIPYETGAPFKYKWTNSDNDSIGNTLSLSNLTPGTYTFTATDSLGCTFTNSYTLDNPTQVVAHLESQIDQTCTGNGSIEVSATGGTEPEGGYYFRLDASAFAQTSTFSNLTAGPHVIAVRDAKNCYATLNDTIKLINPIAIDDEYLTQTICSGETFTVAPNAGEHTPTGTTYTWPMPSAVAGVTGRAAGTSQSSVSGTLTNTANGDRVVTYLVTPSYGICTGEQAAVNVTVHPNDAASITGPSVTNLNTDETFTATAGENSYSWDAGTDGTITSGGSTNTPTMQWSTAGTKTITLTYRDTNNCEHQIVKNITINTIPTVSFPDREVYKCSGDTVQVVLTFTGTAPFSAVIGDEHGETPIHTNSTTYTHVITPNATGDHHFYISELEDGNYYNDDEVTPAIANGFVAPSSNISGALTIHVYNDPTVTLSAHDVLCNGGSTGSVKANAGGTSPFTYAWERDNVAMSATTDSISGLDHATYAVTVTDGHGCKANASTHINEPANELAVTLEPNTGENFCSNQPNYVIYAVGTTGTGTAPYTYEWTGATERTDERIADITPISGNDCGHDYPVSVTVTDAHNCTVTDSYTFSVNDAVAPTMRTGSVWPQDSTAYTCYSSRPAFPTDNAIAALYEDNCNVLEVTHTDEVVSNDDCGWEIVRTYTIKDSCNTPITKTITYEGRDTTAPHINCLSNITVSNDPGVNTAHVTLATPLASDNCSTGVGAITLVNDFNNGTNASGTYSIGTTTVKYIAADACDLKDSCTFTVTVRNTERVWVYLRENSGTYTYDGTEQVVTGYVVDSISNSAYTVNDFHYAGSAADTTCKRTDAGITPMTMQSVDFVNDNPYFTNVGFRIADGMLTVNKKPIVILADSDSKEYDGTALTADSYSLTDGTALAATDHFDTVTVTGSQTTIGSSANVASAAVIFNSDDENVTSNYTITYRPGTLTVTGSTDALVIKSKNQSWVYDGEEHSYPNYVVIYAGDTATADTTGRYFTLSTGDVVHITNPASITYVSETGTENNTFNYTLTNASQYENVSVVYGDLEITKRPITFTAVSDEKVYDGDTLRNSYHNIITPMGATTNVLQSISVVGSQVEVGSSANVISDAVIVKLGTDIDVTDNYDITYVNGTLTVTPNNTAITVISNDHTWTYDGEEHTEQTYTVIYGGEVIASNTTDLEIELPTGDTLTITPADTASVTHVSESGTDNNTFDITIQNGDNYGGTITKEYGDLTITAREVTFTAGSANKIFDGTALTKDEWTLSAGTIASTDEIDTVTVTGSQTLPGSSANVPSNAIIVNAGTTTDVTSDYTIHYVNGALVVTESNVAIRIVSDDHTWTYDGETHRDYTYHVYYGDVEAEMVGTDSLGFILPTGDWVVITPDLTANVTHVSDNSSENNTFTYVLTNESRYTGTQTIEYGTIEINPRPVTIIGGSDSKLYDGTPLTKNSWTIADTTPIPATDTLTSVTMTGSQTEVGESGNTPSNARFYKRGTSTNVTSDYDVTYVDGTLEVTGNESPIKVESMSHSWTYDGQTHTYETYRVYYNGTTSGVTADATGKIFTLPTGDKITITPTDTANVTYVSDNAPNNNTFTYSLENDSWYTGVRDTVYGTLTINKANITIVGNDSTKTYDGTPLVQSNWHSLTDPMPTDSIASVTVTGSQTNAGTSDNTPSDIHIVDREDPTKDVTENYNITYTPGTLTVNPLSGVVVTITEHGGTFEYDGTTHTVTGYDVTTNNPLYNDTCFTYNGPATDSTVSRKFVGTSDMEVEASDFENTNTNFTNVTFVVVDRQLVITPVSTPLVVTANSNSKTYDGTPLVDTGYTLTSGTLAPGDTIIATVVGSQTTAGNSSNTITVIKVYNSDNEDVTSNYTINTNLGVLTVNKRLVVITADDSTKMYDGTALMDSHWMDTPPTNVAPGDTVSMVTVTGSRTEVGVSLNGNVPSSAVIINQTTSEDVTANYDVEYHKGTLTVTANTTPIVISSKDTTYVYDGEEHTHEVYVVTYGGDTIDPINTDGTQFELPTGDTITITPTAGITEYPENAPENNTFTYTLDNEDQYGSGDVTTDFGTITITKRPLELTANSVTVEYDGDLHTYQETTSPYYTNTGDSALVAGQTISSITITGQGRLVGDYPTAITDGSVIITEGVNDVTENYDITLIPGEIKITDRTTPYVIDIYAKKDTVTYDGTEHTVSGFETLEFEVDGNTYYVTDNSVSATATGTDVGEYDNTVTGTPVVIDIYGNDVTNQFTVNTHDGVLKIEACPLLITINDSKVYDGTVLSSAYTTAVATGLVEGDILSNGVVKTTDVVVGTYTYADNTSTITSDFATAKGIGNYNVTYVVNQTIERSGAMVLNCPGDSMRMYNGDALIAYATASVPDHSTVSIQYSVNLGITWTDTVPYIKHVSQSPLTVWVRARNSNYYDEDCSYKLTITPRTIILTSADSTKKYDGTPLERDSVREEGDGWAPGESASYDVTGTITNAGDIENVFTYTFDSAGMETEDYDIYLNYGTLTVIPRTDVVVTITEHGGIYQYDGTEHTVTGYDVSINDPTGNYAVTDFTFGGDSIVSAIEVGVYSMDVVPSNFTNYNTNYDSVTFIVVQDSLVIYDTMHVMTIVVGNVPCNSTDNGSVDLTIGGGRPDSPVAYTYVLDGNVTGIHLTGGSTATGEIAINDLPADTYTIVAYDTAGHSVTHTFTVGESSELELNVTVPKDPCPNQTTYPVSVDVTGGSGTYTLTWTGVTSTTIHSSNPEVANIASDLHDERNTYTVSLTVVDEYGCTATKDTTFTTVDNIERPGAATFTPHADTTITLLYGRTDTLILLDTPTLITSIPDVVITNDAPTNQRYYSGTHTITWTATDTCGNSITVEQKVIVNYADCGQYVWDADSNRYDVRQIGPHCWTGQNARSVHYVPFTRALTEIPVKNKYNNSDSLFDIYGYLYTWYSAVNTPEGDDTPLHADASGRVRGICPEGWAIPTQEEYILMVHNSGDLQHAKEPSTLYWLPGLEGVAPNLLFNARGGGWLNATTAQYEGLLTDAHFWTVTPAGPGETVYAIMVDFGACEGEECSVRNKGSGASIRCIKIY